MASGTLRRFCFRIFLATLMAGLALFARQAFWIEPDSLVVAEYRIAIPAWPAALDGFRIAAVGDLHGGSPFVDEPKLEEVVRRVTAAKPDLIVWLGDYVIHKVLGGKFMDPETVARILSRAQARYGQVAIVGNHDRGFDTPRVERAFEREGVPFLRWKGKILVINGVRLNLYGLDDFELSQGFWPKLITTLEEWRELPTDETLVVLSHNPDVFPLLPARVALTLASHTHGGQVRLPLIGSPIVPSSFGQRYARGSMVEEGRHLFVNPGIGTSIIPIRFGVPPEISLLVLRGSAATVAGQNR